ncbi:MAG: hypothetical protein QM813_15025 [Verrucomicrobiota bacterium]
MGAVDDATPRLQKLLNEARQNPPSNEPRRLLPQLGTMALATGNEELVAESSRALVEVWSREQRQESYARETVQFAASLLNAGYADSAASIAEAVRKVIGPNNRTIRAQLEMLDTELDLRRGKLERVTPVAWLDVDRTAGDQLSLIWDLGIAQGDLNDREFPMMIRGGDVDSQLHGFDVELYFGEGPSSMRSLVRLKNTDARGVWVGPLQAGEGFVRVIATRGDDVLLGEALPVAVGRNLVREQETPKFQAVHPSGEVVVVKGGPLADGEYSSWRYE